MCSLWVRLCVCCSVSVEEEAGIKINLKIRTKLERIGKVTSQVRLTRVDTSSRCRVFKTSRTICCHGNRQKSMRQRWRPDGSGTDERAERRQVVQASLCVDLITRKTKMCLLDSLVLIKQEGVCLVPVYRHSVTQSPHDGTRLEEQIPDL